MDGGIRAAVAGSFDGRRGRRVRHEFGTPEPGTALDAGFGAGMVVQVPAGTGTIVETVPYYHSGSRVGCLSGTSWAAKVRVNGNSCADLSNGNRAIDPFINLRQLSPIQFLRHQS